eukprot:Awhi_evm1s13008
MEEVPTVLSPKAASLLGGRSVQPHIDINTMIDIEDPDLKPLDNDTKQKSRSESNLRFFTRTSLSTSNNGTALSLKHIDS